MGSIQISILVIDDDATNLNVVAEYLRRMNHHVVTMRSPNDALCTLRMNYKEFDLILTDVHMPQMSGLDLLKQVVEEFQLPVVLMSDDYDKDIMLKGLEDGASFYLVKPITEDSLRTIWQFAISGERFCSSGNWNTIPSNSSRDTSQTETTIHEGCYDNDSSSVSFTTSVDADSNGGKDIISKKPKLIWTTSLHNLFLEAVNKIGLERAVPKKILDYMNVPGLRRENVASHLQKYRIFLKRISEASYSEYGIPIDGKERPLRSSFVLNEITYLANNIQQQYKDLLTQRGADTIMRNDEPLFKNHREEILIEGDCSHEENYLDILFNNNNPNNGSFQLPTSNYVGLRINNNGELVGTLNNLPCSRDLDENNSTKGVLSEGVLNTIVASEDVGTYNNISQNASLPLFGVNDVTPGGVNNEPCLGDLDNLNSYISNIDFGFGSFNGLDDGLEGLDCLDQEPFLADGEISLENYYAKE